VVGVASVQAPPALLALTGAELDELFRSGSADAIPDGDTAGTLLLGVGSRRISEAAAGLVRLLAWKGKVFDRDRGELLNKLTPFGVRSVRARVYVDASRLDGREAIVLDYSTTSLLAQSVRDEIRSVEPGVYVGLVFWRGRKVARFSLTTEG
jgi:hypothetical protein